MLARSKSPNQCAGPFGKVYDFYIERPWLMQALGRLVWGVDISTLYESIALTIPQLATGASVLDVPCGGGVALRALSPAQQVRYVGGDLSELMLDRARRRARSRGLEQVELRNVDMVALPFADEQADVFISYSGLHMLDRPELAVNEIARCLKPDGRLVGTTFLREGSRRQRLLFAIGHRRGHALPPRQEDLRGWFSAAGMEQVEIAPARGFAVFSARKRDASG